MFLHGGGGCNIQSKHIVGIFDMDSATVSVLTKKFLHQMEKNKKTEMITSALPKSFILTSEKKTACASNRASCREKKTRNGRKIIFLFTFSGYSAATRTKQRFLCIREIYSKATKQKIGNKTLKKTPC